MTSPSFEAYSMAFSILFGASSGIVSKWNSLKSEVMKVVVGIADRWRTQC
jgi:hypothetical protein